MSKAIELLAEAIQEAEDGWVDFHRSDQHLGFLTEEQARADFEPEREALAVITSVVEAARKQADASEGGTLVALDDALAAYDQFEEAIR